MCERTGCDTDVTAAPSGPEKRFCSGKCRAKANRTKRKMPDTRIATAAAQAALAKRSIPSDVFAAVLRRYLADYQGRVGAEAGEKETAPSQIMGKAIGLTGYQRINQAEVIHFANARYVLAEEAGMSENTLFKHLEGKRQWISFEDADRLLCKMGLIHLWWTDLAEYYEAAAA